jgi:membrane fusion protein (multidrug efflux system)
MRTILLMLGLALAAGCGDKIEPGRLDAPAGSPAPTGARTATLEATLQSPRIDVVGTVTSEKIVTLSSRLSAYVSEESVDAGDRVKAGQLLLTLDNREIREQLAAAEAQMKQAESEYNRAKQLFEKNAATDQSLIAAESGYNTARAQVERVKVMLTYADVVAPIDGIVTERRIDVGDLASPGQPLLSVYDPLHMRLEAPVPVRLVGRLALGQDVDVTLDHPARTLKGTITEIVSEIDPLSRTQKVKVRLQDAGGDVLPGTFGRLWVEDAPRKMILVDASAVAQVGQLETVRVIENGRVLRRLVKTGARVGDRLEVLSGLAEGDVVLLNPASEPVPHGN